MHRIRIHLRLINNCLSVVVVCLASYIIASPFLPQLSWWVKHESPVKGVIPSKQVVIEPGPVQPEQPQGNSLIVPSLSLRETVHGGDVRALNKGIWRIPYTGTPDEGGNTVLVGHRFTYGGPAVFYHLDKVQKHDRIGLVWQGEVYEYEVFNVMVVSAETLSVEAKTTEPRLTLYTCTPLWTAKDRLVIQAKPVEAQP